MGMTVGRRPLLLGAAAAAASGHAAAAGATGPRLDRSALEPTFADEFETFSRWNGRSGRWRTVFGSGGPLALGNRSTPGSGDKQVYMDPEFAGPAGGAPLGIDPFRTEGSVLRIEARPTPPEARARLWDRPYTSGLITTKFSFWQLYGHFEARAKLPGGRGLWPAFWLLPKNGSWPPELDVFEILGRDPATLYANIVVTGRTWQDNPPTPVRVPDTSADFHVYGVSWQPDEVRWYLDDQEIARRSTPPEMNTPMYVLLNLAVGGTWGGDPDEKTRFPAHLLIDWVRAHRFAR